MMPIKLYNKKKKTNKKEKQKQKRKRKRKKCVSESHRCTYPKRQFIGLSSLCARIQIMCSVVKDSKNCKEKKKHNIQAARFSLD